jgi:hypothetical protein
MGVLDLVDGSYTVTSASGVVSAAVPPAINKRPSGSATAAAPAGTLMLPASAHVPLATLGTLARSRRPQVKTIARTATAVVSFVTGVLVVIL